MDELIPIGQFSGLTWLSPKALRLYQTQGLIEPAWVDPDSGYRYYRAAQVPVATRIAVLRRAGVPLAQIATFLVSPTRECVEAWRAALDVEVMERRRLLDHVAQLINAEEAPTMTDPTDAGAAKITLQRAIPVLASLDLEATQRFYADKICFTPVARYPDHAICARDGSSSTSG